MSARQARVVRRRTALVRCAERVVWAAWDGESLREARAWQPLLTAVAAELPALAGWAGADREGADGTGA